jgi:preprotein translocase subunit SecG
MSILGTALPYIQIVLSILLIIGVLLQRSETGIGGAFGSADLNTNFHTRRGAEKVIFNATIVIAILFVLSAIIALLQ